ncbi:hypothetical protein DFQ27_009419 [Actinomortierella ambigua]|uniref:Uncharacterized protein n=1 Tax=Actinomortierella ambigua TaxID=1343610 RepID=A0A9P6PP26_9FUNG|nr:hypothetical protein DFQ27_009419 [Actinomortierella ambigua]
MKLSIALVASCVLAYASANSGIICGGGQISGGDVSDLQNAIMTVPYQENVKGRYRYCRRKIEYDAKSSCIKVSEDVIYRITNPSPGFCDYYNYYGWGVELFHYWRQ